MSMQSIESRRSTRESRGDTIPMELIDQVLAVGIKAPFSKNEQPWRFVVVGGKAKEEMLGLFEAGLTREQNGRALLPKNRNALPDVWNTLKAMKQAPVIIMVLNEKPGSPFEIVSNGDRVAETVNMQSISAAIENITLAAEGLDLGTLWICNTFLVYTELCERLHTDRQLAAAIVLGYPDEMPPPRLRKKFQDVVTYRSE